MSVRTDFLKGFIHMPTPTTTDIQIATDTSFNTLSINETKPYCTTRTFTPEELPHGVDLYMRVRHHTDDASMDTSWSDTRYFQIEPDAEIIGICMDNSDTTKKPVWNWIDKDGNRVDSFNYQEYPIYKNVEMVRFSDTPGRGGWQYLKIPRVYVKTMVSGPINTFAAGKKCWWISNRPVDDFYIHPAFCRNDDNGYTTNICEYVYFQQMPSSTTGGGFASPGDDFRVFDIYDFGLIRLLITIANTGSDDSLTFDSSSNINFTFYDDYVSGAFLKENRNIIINGMSSVYDAVYMVNPVQSCTKVLDDIIISFLGSSALEYTDDLTQNTSLTKCLIPGLKNTTGFGPVRIYGIPPTGSGAYIISPGYTQYSCDYVSGSVLLGYKDGNTSTDSLTCDSMCLFIPKLFPEIWSEDVSFAYYSHESVKYFDLMDPGKTSGNKGPNWLLRCYGKTPLNMVIRPFAQGTPQPGYTFNGNSTDTIRYCAY